MMICLAIDAFFPSCRYVIRDAISCCPPDYNDRNRLLGGGGVDEEICTYPLVETDNTAGCDYHKYQGVHIAHKVLFWTTVVILSSFEFELLFLSELLNIYQYLLFFLFPHSTDKNSYIPNLIYVSCI